MSNKAPMRFPKYLKSPFAGTIRTSYPIEINLNFTNRAAVRDRFRQAGCPFPHKRSLEESLGSITKKKHRSSQHDHCKRSFLTKLLKDVTDCNF